MTDVSKSGKYETSNTWTLHFELYPLVQKHCRPFQRHLPTIDQFKKASILKWSTNCEVKLLGELLLYSDCHHYSHERVHHQEFNSFFPNTKFQTPANCNHHSVIMYQSSAFESIARPSKQISFHPANRKQYQFEKHVCYDMSSSQNRSSSCIEFETQSQLSLIKPEPFTPRDQNVTSTKSSRVHFEMDKKRSITFNLDNEQFCKPPRIEGVIKHPYNNKSHYLRGLRPLGQRYECNTKVIKRQRATESRDSVPAKRSYSSSTEGPSCDNSVQRSTSLHVQALRKKLSFRRKEKSLLESRLCEINEFQQDETSMEFKNDRRTSIFRRSISMLVDDRREEIYKEKSQRLMLCKRKKDVRAENDELLLQIGHLEMTVVEASSLYQQVEALEHALDIVREEANTIRDYAYSSLMDRDVNRKDVE